MCANRLDVYQPSTHQRHKLWSQSRYGYEIYETVAEALTLNGIHLAADAVLLIGEYSDYPKKDRGQKLYLRYKLMQPIVEVFRADGCSVPMFSDKHLSYS